MHAPGQGSDNNNDTHYYMKKFLTCRQVIACLMILLGQTAWAVSYSDSNDNLAMPFKATTLNGDDLASGTQWYKIRVEGGKYWAVGDGQVTCAAPSGGKGTPLSCMGWSRSASTASIYMRHPLLAEAAALVHSVSTPSL